MIKPASSLCNLSCEYCFYRDVAEHREHLGFGIMTHETATRLIEKALIFADGKPVSFAFQGGEPTLAGLSYFEHFVRTVREKNEKNSPVFYSIQTNGTQINDAWARFLAKHNFLTGLSLDGDFDGNKFRKKPSGQNTFYQIMNAAAVLRKHGAEFNILTVLTGYCAENGERIYRFFRKKGFRYLQFIPCLRPFGSDEESELYMTSAQYADFLIRVFNLYVKDYVRGQYISVREFDNLVRLYLGQRPEQCGMAGHCAHQFVSESNGNIYPCDFLLHGRIPARQHCRYGFFCHGAMRDRRALYQREPARARTLPQLQILPAVPRRRLQAHQRERRLLRGVQGVFLRLPAAVPRVRRGSQASAGLAGQLMRLTWNCCDCVAFFVRKLQRTGESDKITSRRYHL